MDLFVSLKMHTYTYWFLTQGQIEVTSVSLSSAFLALVEHTPSQVCLMCLFSILSDSGKKHRHFCVMPGNVTRLPFHIMSNSVAFVGNPIAACKKHMTSLVEGNSHTLFAGLKSNSALTFA